MISYFELLVATRYLRSKKKDTIISVIAGFSLVGVALGVAALIVVMAVMNGFHKEIAAKMTGFNGDITIKTYSGYIDDYDNLSVKIKAHPDVISAIPMIEGQVMANNGNHASGALVKGIRISDLKYKPLVAGNITMGDLEGFDDEHILIGYQLAQNLRINKYQNKVTLLSPKGSYTAIGMIPRIKVFEVAAYFQSGMYAYDEATIFMSLEMAQIYFKLKDKVNIIELMVNNPENSDLIAKELSSMLGDGYLVSDWKTTNEGYFNVLKTERVVMFIILTLIILVAAFNIISSLIMLVKDKSKDIAILRTMGASPKSILKIFLICGLSVGIIGTLVGAIAGISFAANIESIRQALQTLSGSVIFDPIIYYLSALPSDLQVSDVVKIILLSITLSVLATIYPAYKASKQSPIEGLRYE
jgi:lipoprotein-releasing system permease protein